uniref:DUF1376 domain-containing protein n=1 Tax=viral metagenome TaxID=1070528 RepID=A0A6H1ZCX0_9ZZZZ
MEYLKICNWEKYQHYSQRNPPWIKLHNQLLDNYEYGRLRDDSKLLLVSLYLLASKCDNLIPNDPIWIKQKTMIQGKINIDPLIKAEFIKKNNYISNCTPDDSIVQASCKQNGGTETETETEKTIAQKSTEVFDQFWSDYPKKRSKGDAEKAWARIKPTQHTSDKIFISLSQAKKSNDWLKESGKYIPYPATWLRAKGWEDEYYNDPLDGVVSDITKKSLKNMQKWMEETGNE